MTKNFWTREREVAYRRILKCSISYAVMIGIFAYIPKLFSPFSSYCSKLLLSLCTIIPMHQSIGSGDNRTNIAIEFRIRCLWMLGE